MDTIKTKTPALTITWNGGFNSKSPTETDFEYIHTWQVWDHRQINTSIDHIIPGARLIEDELGFPENTLAVLQHAFELKLNRHTAWDLSQIPEKEVGAFIQAAKIFKRGVPWKEKDGAINAAPWFKSHGSYSIYICDDQPRFPAEAFVIVDENVLRSWPHFEEHCDYVFKYVFEKQKDLNKVAEVLKAWRASPKHKRGNKWVIVGGGLVEDICAFAASLEGCEFTFLPTTLLSMVDASVGGKTAVNFYNYGKNLLGSFSFPNAVYIWPRWLMTLPHREVHAAAAECIKHGIISGDRVFLKKMSHLLHQSNLDAMVELLPQIIQVKADLVSKDPYERGVRALLNLGHTLGHALEAMSHDHHIKGDYLLHGEAVAFGLLFTGWLSHTEGHLDKKTLMELYEYLVESKSLLGYERFNSRLGMDLQDPKTWDRFLYHILNDKKQKALKENSVTYWVLMRDFGDFVYSKVNGFLCPVPTEDLKKTWNAMVKFLESKMVK